MYMDQYISMDQYMSGLMGNVEGYEIDPSRVDSPVLYVGQTEKLVGRAYSG